VIERLAGDAATVRSEEIAGLLSAAFAAPDRGWSAASVAETLASPGLVAFLAPAGCALLRMVADEAEILTVAVIPGARRQGLASELVDACLKEAGTAGATSVHLEVGAGNAAARTLYARAGFAETGRRRGYYRSTSGREDAVLMTHRIASCEGRGAVPAACP
jgi:ribosomal-protein-alanine N-acetyltransferase